MMFASLDKIKDKETGEMRERNKAETEEISFKYAGLSSSPSPA